MLLTNNKEWGFYGTAKQDGGEAFAEDAWKAAFEHISKWMNWGEQLTRDFLDSRSGRQYADVMHGKENWRDALTRHWNLEHECRVFYQEVDPRGYKRWCLMNGDTPAERTLIYSGISKEEMKTTVNYLLGVDYPQSMINEFINRAEPLAQALSMILVDIPEEIRDIYLNGGVVDNDDSAGMSPS